MSDRRRSVPRTARSALRAALAAAYEDGRLDPVVDAAPIALAADLAAAIDNYPAGAEAYGRARLARMYLEALRELKLTPASRRSEVDHLAEFLADLAAPTPGTPDEPVTD